jgi:hypothetical protein
MARKLQITLILTLGVLQAHIICQNLSENKISNFDQGSTPISSDSQTVGLNDGEPLNLDYIPMKTTQIYVDSPVEYTIDTLSFVGLTQQMSYLEYAKELNSTSSQIDSELTFSKHDFFNPPIPCSSDGNLVLGYSYSTFCKV